MITNILSLRPLKYAYYKLVIFLLRFEPSLECRKSSTSRGLTSAEFKVPSQGGCRSLIAVAVYIAKAKPPSLHPLMDPSFILPCAFNAYFGCFEIMQVRISQFVSDYF